MFNTNNDLFLSDEDAQTAINGKNDFLAKNEVREDWLNDDYEGQLSIDVYQTDKDIIIKSTIAGIRPEDVDIAINNDMVTIRGSRKQTTEVEEEDYLFQECYWGGFSRSIILPQPVKADKVKASLENGILTIILPKAPQVEKVQVKVKNTKPIKKEKITNVKSGKSVKKKK